MIQPWVIWVVGSIAFVGLGLGAAAIGLMLDLRDKIDRLLQLPQAQPNKIAGESLAERRSRFLAASRAAR